MVQKTKLFSMNHSNILFTSADKGNVIVALDKNVYIDKIVNMLQDKDTNSIINKNPIRKISVRLRDLLKKWKESNYITAATYKNLSCSDGFLPRAYGLPKIHKRNISFRIIVLSINKPLYNIIVPNSPLLPHTYTKSSQLAYQNLRTMPGTTSN